MPLLLAEMLLRAFGPVLPGNYDTGAYLTRHPTYGHYHPANYGGWIRRDEYLVHVRTNSAGQRGAEMPAEKPRDVFRILVLGDSFVEAVQVAEHERFLARLDGLLNSPGGPRRFELIDGGCGGWGTGQELLYLRHDGLRYRPDLVLLAFFATNDVVNNSLELELDGRVDLALKPYYRPTESGLELVEARPRTLNPFEQLGFALREQSTLYNVAESGVLQKLSLDEQWAAWRDLDAMVETRDREVELYRTRLDMKWRNAWTVTERLVREVKRESAVDDGRFAMVSIPSRTQVEPGAWFELSERAGDRQTIDAEFPNKQVARIADRTSTPLLDLLSAFREAHADEARAPLYFSRDQHWTSEGHALAAEHIAEFLKRERLIYR